MTKPVLTGTSHTLPFEKLSPLDFEHLCLWLVGREGYERAEHLGEAGGEEGRAAGHAHRSLAEKAGPSAQYLDDAGETPAVPGCARSTGCGAREPMGPQVLPRARSARDIAK